MGSTGKVMLAAGGAALVGVLLYLPTLGFPLVWDDLNSTRLQLQSPFETFGQSVWQGEHTRVLGRDPFYRPVVGFSLQVDRAIGRGRPWFFHLSSILLHASVAAAVAILAWLLLRSAIAAGLAGALFAVHPMLADSVSYVSGRTDLMAALGLAVAACGMVLFSRGRGWGAALALAGSAFAALSKETGLLFVPVALLWLLWERRLPLRYRLLLFSGLVLVAAACLGARVLVLGRLAGPTPVSTGSLFLLGIDGFGRSLVSFVAPFGRVFVWPRAVLTPFAAPAAIYLLLPVVLRRWFRSQTVVLWFWGVALLLPVTPLAGFGPFGRLLYVPAVGIVLLAADLLLRALPAGGVHRKVAAVSAAVLAVAMVPVGLARQGVWRSERGLFERMTIEAPGYSAGHYNLGTARLATGDSLASAASFRQAVALDSNIVPALVNLGALEQRRGDLRTAARLLLRAARLDPSHAATRVNLAVVLHRLGDDTGARAALRQALEADPGNGGAAYNLAVLYAIAGQADSATAFAEQACCLMPADPRPRSLLRSLQGGLSPRGGGAGPGR